MNSFVEKDHSVRVIFVTNNHLVLVNFGGFLLWASTGSLLVSLAMFIHPGLTWGVAVAVVFSVSLSACLVCWHFLKTRTEKSEQPL